MKYRDFYNKDKKTKEMLLSFHDGFVYKPNSGVGEDDCSKAFIRWFNARCKELCGIGLNGGFRAKTLWSRIAGPKNGALFKTSFIGYRIFNKDDDSKDTVRYRLFLSTHNTQADTDMSDSSLVYIEFAVRNNHVIEYSYNF